MEWGGVGWGGEQAVDGLGLNGGNDDDDDDDGGGGDDDDDE